METPQQGSALDKIKALKEKAEQHRQAEEERKIQEAAQAEQQKREEYTAAESALQSMKTQAQQLEGKRSDIKQKRESIIRIGRQARKEAEQDEETAKIIHSKEGFDSLFEGERAEWNKLRGDVSSANAELDTLNKHIPEQEAKVQKLYEETPEGKIAAEEKIAENFLYRKYFSVKALEKGEWSSSNLINLDKIAVMPEEERAKTIDALKHSANRMIETYYADSRKNSGIEDIKKDLEKVERFRNEQHRLVSEVRKLDADLDGYQQTYEQLLPAGSDMRQLISQYGLKPSALTGFGERPDLKKFADTIEAVSKTTTEAYDVDEVTAYVNNVRQYNEKLISLFKEEKTDELKRIFGRGSNQEVKDILGMDNLYQLARYPYKTTLVAKHAGREEFHKNNWDVEKVKASIEAKEKEFELAQERTTAFANAKIDLALSTEDIREKTKNDGLRNDAWGLERRKESLEQDRQQAANILYTIAAYKQHHLDLLAEKIEVDYGVDIMGRKSQLQQTYEQQRSGEKLLNDKRIELRELREKKPGIFGKSKHESQVAAVEKEVKDLEEQQQTRERNLGELKKDKLLLGPIMEKLQDAFNLSNKTQQYFKDAGLESGMTLGEALEKLEAKLETVKAQEFPVDLAKLLDAYHAALKAEKAAKQAFDRK